MTSVSRFISLSVTLVDCDHTAQQKVKMSREVCDLAFGSLHVEADPDRILPMKTSDV